MQQLRAWALWLSARLKEPSTISGIGLAIAGGAAVPAPYSIAVIACGIVALFMKEAAGA